MFAVPSSLVPVALRLSRRNRNYRTRELAERHLSELAETPRVITAPAKALDGVRVSREERYGWPVFRMTPDRRPVRGSLLYFHGGAYVHGIHAAHWAFLAHLVAGAGVEAVVPMYPLVPEGGTAAEVAEVAMRIAQDLGRDTILGGDSAGAQIAFSTAVGLRDCAIIAPLTVLICPPVDLQLLNPGLAERANRDPWLCREGLLVYTRRWLAEHGFAHELNPINADPAGLGPVVVFSGTLDILNLDVGAWVERLRAAGVRVEYHEAAGQVHVYPLLPTRPGRLARRRIVQLLDETLPAG